MMLLGREKDLVRGVIQKWAKILRGAGFIMSEKSNLGPTQCLKWFGKDVDLKPGRIESTDGAMDMALVSG